MAEIEIRKPNEDEFLKVHEFVTRCPPLEAYPMHVFRIMLRYFGDTCFVAEKDGNFVGWVLGIVSRRGRDRYVVWQVGVGEAARGHGLGKLLLHAAAHEAKERGCELVEATIDPENILSQKLFESVDYRNVSAQEGETVTVEGNLAVKDYYSPGRHFMVYQKELA